MHSVSICYALHQLSHPRSTNSHTHTLPTLTFPSNSSKLLGQIHLAIHSAWVKLCFFQLWTEGCLLCECPIELANQICMFAVQWPQCHWVWRIDGLVLLPIYVHGLSNLKLTAHKDFPCLKTVNFNSISHILVHILSDSQNMYVPGCF